MMKRPPEAFRSPRLFDTGAGYVVVCRFKSDGRCEAGIFLIDTYCLGVKNGDFVSFSSFARLEEDLLARLFRDEEPVRMTPSSGRKLIEDAAAYARRLGFAPCAAFKKACRVLGGITTAGCDEEFAFGRQGRPCYIEGPHESAARSRSILLTLERTCGAGGYDYLLASDSDEFDAPDEETTEGWGDEVPRSASSGSQALHEMARRVEAEEPGVVVHVNPPGRTKISDRLSLLAEPLLDAAPAYESKKSILHLAALAWNVTVAERIGSESLLQKILPLVSVLKGEAMFHVFVARMDTLFPEENRIISNLEIDPCSGNEFNLRVMSLAPEDNLPGSRATQRPRHAHLSPV